MGRGVGWYIWLVSLGGSAGQISIPLPSSPSRYLRGMQSPLHLLTLHLSTAVLHTGNNIFWWGDMPSGSDGKESVNAGHTGSIPGLGRSPGEGNGNSTPVFLPGGSHGQRSLVVYGPWGHKESDPSEQLTFMFNSGDSELLVHESGTLGNRKGVRYGAAKSSWTCWSFWWTRAPSVGLWVWTCRHSVMVLLVPKCLLWSIHTSLFYTCAVGVNYQVRPEALSILAPVQISLLRTASSVWQILHKNLEQSLLSLIKDREPRASAKAEAIGLQLGKGSHPAPTIEGLGKEKPGLCPWANAYVIIRHRDWLGYRLLALDFELCLSFSSAGIILGQVPQIAATAAKSHQ